MGARESVRALVVAYAERLDAGDLDGVATLFEHGVFRSSRGGAPLEGRAAVRQMYDPVILYDEGTPRTKHVLGNIEIYVEEVGTARASCTFVVFQAVPGVELRAVLSGRYQDRFEVVDGEWRFVERVVHPDLLGDLRHHMRAP